jgi:hypothetical protein
VRGRRWRWADEPGRGGKRMARKPRKMSLEHIVAGVVEE